MEKASNNTYIHIYIYTHIHTYINSSSRKVMPDERTKMDVLY